MNKNKSQPGENNKEFNSYEWNELIDDLIKEAGDITEAHKKKLEELKVGIDKVRKEIYFPNLSHIYLLISRRAAYFLVEYHGNPDNLENGYQNLLKLISMPLKLKPIEYHYEEKDPNKQSLETQTQHLFKNRELLNIAMDNYVREIERIRNKKINTKMLVTSLLSMFAAIGSMITAIVLGFSP